MPFEPLRFLHAANARLDQAIGETFPLPSRVASIVQDATRAAFERLIGVALDRNVDFLLLAGNTFVEAEHSLAARLALVDGLEQLAQESIRVFVLPGPLDPADAWQQIPDLPTNVTILDGTSKGSVAIKREGKSIARIGTSPRLPHRKGRRASERELRSESQRPVPFAIGLLATSADADDARILEAWSAGQESGYAAVAAHEATSGRRNDELRDSPVDYLAFGAGRARRTLAKRKGIAHDPGSVQGFHPRETGPRGATLVGVESDGTVHCDFVPTASVRWERFSISVAAAALSAATVRHDLLRRCRALLEEKCGETSENAWIVEWILRGSAAALAPFDAASCRQFGQELNQASLLSGAEAVVHSFVAHAEPESTLTRPGDDPLHADFAEALAACHSGRPAVFASSLAELAAPNQEWSREWAARLQSLALEAEQGAIDAHAQRFGRKLFRAAAGEGASA
jgi:DNA repair exonuclease SbcCD nuclease subunit